MTVLRHFFVGLHWELLPNKTDDYLPGPAEVTRR
jgi:hypothetical protein